MTNKSRNSQNVFHNIEIDNTALEEDIELNNTRALWRAAIMQKLLDAASNSKKRSAYKSKIQAIQWLKGDSKDFMLVCF